MDVSSGKQQTIFSSTELIFWGPVWLPDEKGLVVLYSNSKLLPKGQIGFISYPEGKFRAITRDTNQYLDVSVSRDGKTLMTVQRETSFRLYSMASREKREERVIPITSRGEAYEFAWMDGNNLVLEYAGKFYRISDRGEDKTLLFDSSQYAGSLETSCQGGRYIVFSGKDPESSGETRSLWRLDTNNNSIKELTDGGSPVCSTNGKWIFFHNNTPSDEILKLSIDGGTAKSLLTKDEFAWFDVSRDGSLLAFLSWDKLEKRPIGLSGAWSPSPKFGLLNMDTGKMGRTLTVTPRPGERVVVRFTPDNKALAYISRINGVDNIWAQPIDGAPTYPITSFKSDEIRDFHWSPGGDRLGIVRGGTDSNVVLIRETNP